MEIAGDGAGAGCSDISGVAVGEGLECGGDVSAGGFSFNEDGGCINQSKESLAGVGDGVGAGEVAFSCAGVGCVFSALLQCEQRAANCSEMSVCPLFFGSALAGASSNLPCTIIPASRLITM